MVESIELLEAHVLGENDWVRVETLLGLCDLTLDAVVELTELGILIPRGGAPSEWQLPAAVLPRLRTMSRLMRDLGVNLSGAALAVELIESRRQLERRVRELERHLRG
jgi:chaperone modulatory protein CbpM